MTLNEASLKADCGNCAALCCMAFAFDKSEQFALDKEAGVACENLNECGNCTIHEKLSKAGFQGCVNYDCFGAGQHVTQEVFGGKSWQDDPALKVPMQNAFRVMRHVHDMLLLLTAAAKLPLSDAENTTRQALIAEMTPAGGWTAASLESFERGSCLQEATDYFTSLRPHAEERVGS
ncbi:MAG: hypothetical protein JKY34_11735 [Kordiimonadaceae bacterium]|nr:hypothetical protein [Kordiimonadaceae bacterium]